MYYQLLHRMKRAENNVVCHPNQRKPARPVAPAEHENSTNNRHEAEKKNPHHLILKRTLSPQLTEVVSKPDYARRYQQPTDDSHREWTFAHKRSLAQ